MPEYEHKINTGTLFTNKFKKGESHPDFTGKANINGDMKDLSMWFNKEKNYYYIKINEPYAKPQSDMWPAKQKVPVLGTVEEDGTINYNDPINMDDIPF